MTTVLKLSLFMLFLSGLFVSKAHALVPVESLVLGNFSENYSEYESDPLNYVYARDLVNKSENKKYKESLAVYRGFYEEGKNTINYCALGNEIRYQTNWQKVQAKRSMMALIQYIGIDLSVRAIPKYAKALEFTREEYSNMVTGLVGNFCSSNISIISKRELLNNFFLKFDKENNFELPSVSKNALFSNKLDRFYDSKTALEQELLYTVKIFKSLCSWNGNPDNPGLLVPFLKHAGLLSFFARQMSSLAIDWRESDNFLFLRTNPKSMKVWCDNLICRKVTQEELAASFQFSVGGTNIYDDYRRLYCEDFRNVDYKPKESDPRLAKLMNNMTFDEENFMNSQFIALITGYPDLLLRAKNFSDIKEIIRSSLDYKWDNWANEAGLNFSSDIYFEEPLMIELVDREQYYDFRKRKLKVAFDINMGEFDRINQINGKLKVQFKLKVLNSFLKYYRSQIHTTGLGEVDKLNHLKDRFKLNIKDGVESARKKFIVPPWKGDLEALIVSELTEQLNQSSNKFLNLDLPGHQEITIEVNYGLFALKYLNHQFNAAKQASQK